MLFMILLTGATVVNAQSRKQNNWFVDTSVGSVADMFTVNVGIHKQKTDRFSLGFTSGAMVSASLYCLCWLMQGMSIRSNDQSSAC